MPYILGEMIFEMKDIEELDVVMRLLMDAQTVMNHYLEKGK